MQIVIYVQVLGYVYFCSCLYGASAHLSNNEAPALFSLVGGLVAVVVAVASGPGAVVAAGVLDDDGAGTHEDGVGGSVPGCPV